MTVNGKTTVPFAAPPDTVKPSAAPHVRAHSASSVPEPTDSFLSPATATVQGTEITPSSAQTPQPPKALKRSKSDVALHRSGAGAAALTRCPKLPAAAAARACDAARDLGPQTAGLSKALAAACQGDVPATARYVASLDAEARDAVVGAGVASQIKAGRLDRALQLTAFSPTVDRRRLCAALVCHAACKAEDFETALAARKLHRGHPLGDNLALEIVASAHKAQQPEALHQAIASIADASLRDAAALSYTAESLKKDAADLAAAATLVQSRRYSRIARWLLPALHIGGKPKDTP